MRTYSIYFLFHGRLYRSTRVVVVPYKKKQLKYPGTFWWWVPFYFQNRKSTKFRSLYQQNSTLTPPASATKLYVTLFADDTFLCTQNKSFSLLQKEVNDELDKIFIWLASNKLTLNMKKSKYMLVTNNHIPEFCLRINHSLLERCKSYKYLGVVLDEKLNWDAHINHIAPKISRGCGALARLRNCTSIDVLKNVYHALIHSYLRYMAL